ncbi:ESPR-type extended signal peptide-containing protein [Caballeronia sp. M1242]|uniref:ESPR-type extended signal peptide-containing protein n=1 Tax=Caballeronia sp. M1242 TaxID=2814653 RepID=UPI003530138F
MNKSYRSIWNEKVGTFVAVAETTMARGKKSPGAVVGPDNAETACDDGSGEFSSGLLHAAAGIGASIALLFGGSSTAWAVPAIVSCVNGSGSGVTNTGLATGMSGSSCGNNAFSGLANYTGVVLQDDNANPTAMIGVGSNAVVFNAASKIQMNQYLDMTGHSVINVAAGSITSVSTDAINGSQLFSFSNSLSTAVSSVSLSLSTNVSSMSTGISSISVAWSSSSASLSTSMSSISSGWSAASSSLSSSMASVSTGWNNASLSLSTSVSSMSTSVSSMSTAVNSLSTGVSTTTSRVSSLSTSLSSLSVSASTGISSLSTSASTGLSSLSTSLSGVTSSVQSLSTGLSTPERRFFAFGSERCVGCRLPTHSPLTSRIRFVRAVRALAGHCLTKQGSDGKRTDSANNLNKIKEALCQPSTGACCCSTR